MDNNILKYNINPLVSAIGKMPEEFTKEDIINFITANDIRVVNFQDPQLPGQQPPVPGSDSLVRRESGRLQPLLVHRGRFE